jgi:hypothetical protein
MVIVADGGRLSVIVNVTKVTRWRWKGILKNNRMNE